jgi:Protein kinase domain
MKRMSTPMFLFPGTRGNRGRMHVPVVVTGRSRDSGIIGGGAVTVSELTLGIELAGCRVEELVGRGGMGVIYRGTDLRLNRPVAIKLISAERASDAGFRRRFEREARLTAAIEHPNVIPVYAAGEENGHLFLVMRYVAGTDLHALLKREGTLDPRRTSLFVDQVAAALDAAHAAGLVHRDIKPANVLLVGDHVYLSDFGITRAGDSGRRVTDSDEWVGTVDFMSPEHLRGEATTPRSDVYALGCLVHCCLTGRPPFHRPTATATILAHLEEPPPRASGAAGVPAAFDAVIGRALAKDPTDRFASAGDLGQAVRDAAQVEPVARVPETASTRPMADPATRSAPTRVVARTRAAPRPRMLLALAAVAVAAVAVAGLLTGSGVSRSGPLSTGEVARVAYSFADAYGHRDARKLASLMAPDVKRVSPGAAQQGRAAVVAEYRRQFALGGIRAYRLDSMRITPGWTGRAAARYTVPRTAGRPFGGKVVFGMKRVSGRPSIGLITTEPQG